MIDLKSTPIHTILSVEEDLITLECSCGRPFVLKEGTLNDARCDVCLEACRHTPPLTPKELTALSMYMYEKVILEYENKLNRV